MFFPQKLLTSEKSYCNITLRLNRNHNTKGGYRMKVTIKAARVNVNLKMSEAAKLIGVSENTLRTWEKGISSPRADLMPQICKTYECTYDDLKF